MSPFLFWFLAGILVGLVIYWLLVCVLDWAMQDDADEHAERDAKETP